MDPTERLTEELRGLMPGETDPGEVLEAVEGRMPAAGTYLKVRFALTDAFLRRVPLEELAALAEELLDRPLAVFDLGTTPIAMGPRFRAAGDPILMEARNRGYISREFAQGNEFQGFARALMDSTGPFTFRYQAGRQGTNIPRRVHKIYLGGVYIAHCSMLLEREVTPLDDKLQAFFCQLIRLELERISYRPYRDDFENVFFQRLLRGRAPAAEELREQLELQGWKLYHNFRLLNVPRRKGEHTADPASFYFPTFLLNEVRRQMPVGSCVRRCVESGRVLVLLDLKDPDREEWEVRERLDGMLRREGLTAAISRRFSSLRDFRAQAEETEALLALAGEPPLTGLLDDQKLFFHRVVHHLRDVPADVLCPPELLELYRDREGRELLRTVLTYLECDRSVQETARRQFVHRNTVMRRLGRFRELTHLDTEGVRDACRILLAIQLQAYAGRSAWERG